MRVIGGTTTHDASGSTLPESSPDSLSARRGKKKEKKSCVALFPFGMADLASARASFTYGSARRNQRETGDARTGTDRIPTEATACSAARSENKLPLHAALTSCGQAKSCDARGAEPRGRDGHSPLLRWRRREEAGRRERAALVASESVQIHRPRTRRQAETAQDFGFVSDAKTRSTATNNARPVADEAEHAARPHSTYRCRRARICTP